MQQLVIQQNAPVCVDGIGLSPFEQGPAPYSFLIFRLQKLTVESL